MLTTLKEYAEMIDGAQTREELARVYEYMSGCAPDDPADTADDMRDLCRDYVKEICYAEGIHCADVFDPCVTDETRAYGPWGRA